MQPFTYNANPARILFGAGRLSELGAELQRLGAKRALIITTPQQRATGAALMAQLGELAGAVFDGATMHTPTDVTAVALAALQAQRCDALVAIGGGSTIGLAKALALRTGLPQIAIPTTYAGSEVTPILGETADGVKKTQRSSSLLPQVVIYDVDQTLSLPSAMSASSGLNAMAHAVEALYARDANPIISLMAEEGIAALARSLPVVVKQPGNAGARSDAQYGAWLCGTCLGAVGMALHHKLCHVLGGSFDLPHAETHAIVLPHAIAYNAAVAPEPMARLGRALGGTKAPWTHMHAMLGSLGLPTALRDIGMPEHGLQRALDLVLSDSYWNPRPMEAEPLRQLLRHAYEGAAPTLD
ncbi:maleylacetate reductase [Variovorax robiniae]|uniref:Maleylacetate reductase n=1 Tax=Variovorax robiniae TaxID=1836199 RepID=A0ABU8XDQ6_9BURK